MEAFGNPVAQKRHRSSRRNGRTINYDPSKKDKAVFLEQMLKYKPDTPFSEPILVTITAYFQRPKAHYVGGNRSKPLKPSAPIYCASRGRNDWDNIGKFVSDALNGVFWVDDGVIACGIVWKFYDEVPRVELEITPLTF